MADDYDDQEDGGHGHIHQLMQTVKGSITFHTARSTAFPQPAPGTVRRQGRWSARPTNSVPSSGSGTSFYNLGNRPLALTGESLAQRRADTSPEQDPNQGQTVCITRG